MSNGAVNVNGTLPTAGGSITLGPTSVASSGQTEIIELFLTGTPVALNIPSWAVGLVIQALGGHTVSVGDSGDQPVVVGAGGVLLVSFVAGTQGALYVKSGGIDANATIVTFF